MESLEKMKQYNCKTTKGGIIMPSLETFEKKMLLAIKLWPQIGKNGEVQYLLGKGIGVEIALRGEVVGRKKRNNNFPYRSHSDFEIYNCNGYDVLPESNPFTYVFGGQEWYPKNETKGLKNINPELMDNTYETVVYRGEEYLVPQLEILFLDKFLKQESTPREEGCDALLLLQEYELDLNKVLSYFDEYYLDVEMKKFVNPIELYEKCYEALIGRIPLSVKRLLEEDGVETNLGNVTKKINKIRKQFERTPNVSWESVPVVCCPLDIEYVITKNGKLDLSKKTKKELKRLIIELRKSQEESKLCEREKIVKMFEMVEKLHKKAKSQPHR